MIITTAQSAEPEPLVAALAQALRDAGSPWAGVALELMPDKGLAHHHVRLAGTGMLARLPKQSQMGWSAGDNLVYEAACFERAAASGHTPRLAAVLPNTAGLPRGGLLVEEIVGRPARLPHDLTALACALAAIHRLPLPAPGARAPLLDRPDPLADLHAEIHTQSQHLAAARLAPAAIRTMARVQSEFDRLCARPARPPRTLIAFDAHPGNFLIRADGSAVLVDLEKARYSYAPLDLAHATLYTSTTWDVDSHAELSLDQVMATYDTWANAFGHDIDGDQATAMRHWFAPLRAAMWLWSVTWCAKWRALSPRAVRQGGDGEDWSQGHSTQDLVDHVRDRVDCYLSASVIEAIADELDAFQRAG